MAFVTFSREAKQRGEWGRARPSVYASRTQMVKNGRKMKSGVSPKNHMMMTGIMLILMLTMMTIHDVHNSHWNGHRRSTQFAISCGMVENNKCLNKNLQERERERGVEAGRERGRMCGVSWRNSFP